MDDPSITERLGRWARGDKEALDALVDLVYGDLREGARRAMLRERPDHTLEPSALVNEVYLRLLKLKRVTWESRTPFFAFAARLMRQILVEHARAVGAQKRGGEARRLSLETANLSLDAQPLIDTLDLERALGKIEKVDPNLVRLIELRFFTGLSEEEVAEVLKVSRSSVQREWAAAKLLLLKLLREE